MYVRVNEGSSTRNQSLEAQQTLGTSTATIPLILGKVFEKEFNYPFQNTMVLDLSLLETGVAHLGAMCINATSLALYSTLFRGESPIGAVSVALVEDEVVVSPNIEQIENAAMNMIYAGREGAPVYFHASGKMSSENLASALQVADKEVSQLAGLLQKYIDDNADHNEVELLAQKDLVAMARIRDFIDDDICSFIASQNFSLLELDTGMSQLQSKCSDYFRKIGAFRSPIVKVPGSGCVTKGELNLAFDESVKDAIIKRMASKKKRVDGRDFLDVRQTHFDTEKSGMCATDKGGTKIISTVSISTTSRSRKTFESIHNLAITAAPSHLRETRHVKALEYELLQLGLKSNLVVEKALSPILPEFSEFPYYIKAKCQGLSLDGSFPTANVCGLSISLASTGIPLESHIAGVSAGILNQEEAGPIIILDPIDAEERLVDGLVMLTSADTDLITSASVEGVKSNISLDAVLQALDSAMAGNKDILKSMNKICPLDSNPNQGSSYRKITIPKASTGKVIGPGGSNIKNIEALTGALVSVQDKDGAVSVSVYGDGVESCESALRMVKKAAGIGPELEKGKAYKVNVTKILDYGAIVEIEDGVEGWIHISEIKHGRVKNVNEELCVGQALHVICIGRNARGQPQMSLKASIKGSKQS